MFAARCERRHGLVAVEFPPAKHAVGERDIGDVHQVVAQMPERNAGRARRLLVRDLSAMRRQICAGERFGRALRLRAGQNRNIVPAREIRRFAVKDRRKPVLVKRRMRPRMLKQRQQQVALVGRHLSRRQALGVREDIAEFHDHAISRREHGSPMPGPDNAPQCLKYGHRVVQPERARRRLHARPLEIAHHRLALYRSNRV